MKPTIIVDGASVQNNGDLMQAVADSLNIQVPRSRSWHAMEGLLDGRPELSVRLEFRNAAIIRERISLEDYKSLLSLMFKLNRLRNSFDFSFMCGAEPEPRQTFVFDGKDIQSTDHLLQILAQKLNFDEGAGQNWNSLWDQLWGRGILTFEFQNSAILKERMGPEDFENFKALLIDLERTQKGDFEFRFE